MSTYINPNKPGKPGGYSDAPVLVREFLNYTLTIRGLSPRSVNGYYIDLRTFFKYMMIHRGLVAADTDFEKIDISDIDLGFIKITTKAEVYDYLYYVTRERENSAAARSRKISSLRGFFKYLNNKTGQMDHNPVDDIEMPSQKKRLPKYLSLDESLKLLESIDSDFYERDYCIITLFLNCGMRLSELVGINVSDVKDNTIRVVGKGNKERIIYLNEACMQALAVYIEARAGLKNLRDKTGLFVSRRTGQRLSARRVQQIVSRCLAAAGLDGKGYSTHKLRHTAATLLYRHGQVDLLSLKEILGHTNVSTTEIYTHLDSAQLKEASDASPLAKVKVPKRQPKPAPGDDEVEN